MLVKLSTNTSDSKLEYPSHDYPAQPCPSIQRFPCTLTYFLAGPQAIADECPPFAPHVKSPGYFGGLVGG